MYRFYFSRTADRVAILAGILLSFLSLAYFYAADQYYFSTQLMSQMFHYLLMADDMKTAWLTVGVCVLAACWSRPKPVLDLVEFIAGHEAWVVIAAVAAFALGTIFIYHDNAFSMDEYAAVFQAKIFAAGRLTAQLPPSVVDWLIPPGFDRSFLIASQTSGQAMEGYWPGYSLLLAPFEFVGAPWLCNASLAGAAVLLIHRITLEITGDRRAAGWAVLFALASGTFVANAISFYSMQAHLTANLLFVYLLLKPTPYRSFGAGLVGSVALVLHNPFPHTLFAAPWIVAMGFSKEHRSAFVPLVLGYLPISLGLGAGWLHLRGLVTAGASGFDVLSTNLASDFTFPDKAMMDARVASLVKMWIWAVPCLFVFAVLGRARLGEDQRIRLLAQSAVLTFIGYIFFIFDQGHGWGYRYFHSAWGVIPILAGCAFAERQQKHPRLIAFAGAAAVLNLILIVPFQLLQIDAVIARHSGQLPKPRRPGNDVYFVGQSGGFYLADLIQMDPELRAKDLILFSRGTQLDSELRRQNWPMATLVERGPGIEEWNLGPVDQRRPSRDALATGRFEFAYSDHPAF